MLINEIMSTDLVSIHADNSIEEAAKKMRQHNIGALPVFDGKNLVGMVTDRDLVTRCIAEEIPVNRSIADIMTKSCVTCTEADSMDDVIDKMKKHKVRRMIVHEAENDNALIGIFSLDDIARKSNDHKLSTKAFLELNQETRRPSAS